VAYRSPAIDCSWLPPTAEVVIVYNDDQGAAVDPVRPVREVGDGTNVGFGAAVNRALAMVTTPRVVLCNPDVELSPSHWHALTAADPSDVVTIPLVDARGALTSTVSRYPTPTSHLVSGYRLGRFVPRGGRARALLSRGLGDWGRAHRESLRTPVGRWPLATHWVSGAVCSIDTDRLRAVGGFDDDYFLYYEDVDLCRRLARRFPDMQAVVADVGPGVHEVGASGTGRRGAAERARLQSAVRYARSNTGRAWRTCGMLLDARRTVL
jgi:GT2 family glycosyltransferase